ncbi:MAG: hypothetical protein ACRYFU_24815 [Janthinobacterium lividum]
MTFLMVVLFAVGALVLYAVLATVADEVGALCLSHSGNVSLEIKPMAVKLSASRS